MADEIVGGGASAPAAAAPAAAPAAKKIVDINAKASDSSRISKEDLGAKKEIGEEMLGLRKATLYNENVKPAEGNFKRATAGSSDRFKRAFVNAPPMIPHDVEGMLPITGKNNQCLGCHMPDAAKGVGATPIPPSHFTNYRPDTKLEGGKVIKEGKVLASSNTSDVLLAKAKKLNHLYQGRHNCSQCHAPQANIETAVANTFQPQFGSKDLEAGSNLVDVIDNGVK
jgi:cytochrome c-type protein NapB